MIIWRRIFEIVYVLKFISSSVTKQMIHLILANIPLFIYKMQKPYDPPLAANEVRQKLSWRRHRY